MTTRAVLEEHRDPSTPEEVEITLEPREPEWRPDVGVKVPGEPHKGKPRHRLVTIGDSLTHGFQSGAIYNTQISYPAIVAYELGWYEQLRRPAYGGPGGLPLNIEYVVRMLEHEFGDKLDWWEVPFAGFRVRHFMDQLEDYWERGPGSEVPEVKGIYHNLGIYGWDLRDTLSVDSAILEQRILEPKDQLFKQIVENDNDRAALVVLKSARDEKGPLTPLGAARKLAGEGTILEDGRTDDPNGDGIETLIVLLGANNALSTVTQLKVAWSQDDGYRDLEKKGQYTVWTPTHFENELAELVGELKKIRARYVIMGTVPHVTIVPIARGVSTKIRRGSRYFPYYTRVWIRDEEFDAKDDPSITSQQARAIDSAIDQYNEAIVREVKTARGEGRNWFVLDVAGVLDRLAARRYIADPQARPEWWTPYDLPAELKAISPVPDSRYFGSDPNGRIQGGLISLDGVHPTTVCYGILAQEFINVMQFAGVTFYQLDGKTKRLGPVRADFNRLVELDSLISHPPRSLTSDMRLVGWLDQTLDIFRRLFRRG